MWPSIDKEEKSNKTTEEKEDLTSVIRPGKGHGLDYLTEGPLSQKAGIPIEPIHVSVFFASEAIANTLPKDAKEIHLAFGPQIGGAFYNLAVSDNGAKKLSLSDLELILDFDHPASSRRGLLTADPGALGNALKASFGDSIFLAEKRHLRPSPIIVSSGNQKFTFTLQKDIINERIKHDDLHTEERVDDGFTTIEIPIPAMDQPQLSYVKKRLDRLIEGTYFVNPSRTIRYKFLDHEEVIPASSQFAELTKKETCALFYKIDPLVELLIEYIRAKPGLPFYKFVDLFKWFHGREAASEIIAKSVFLNQDCKSEKLQKLQSLQPKTPLGDIPPEVFPDIVIAMKALSKNIEKRSIAAFLQPVGKESFQLVAKNRGWPEPRYLMETMRVTRCLEYECPNYRRELFHIKTNEKCQEPEHVEFPVLLEVCVFDRPEDGQGLKIYQCVNRMSNVDTGIFDLIYDVRDHLTRAGIREQTPVTVIVHLLTPCAQDWLNTGKTTLNLPEAKPLFEKALKKLVPIPKTPREYRRPIPRLKEDPWIPRGSLNQPDPYKRELYKAQLYPWANDEIKPFINGEMKVGVRAYCYKFEGFGKIGKGEFHRFSKAFNDCRKLGPEWLSIDIVKDDPDETRRFSDLELMRAADPATCLNELREQIEEFQEFLPTRITNFWQGEKYFLMMIVEKGDLKVLFHEDCKRRCVPIASSKGWSQLLLRYAVAKLAQEALARDQIPVLLLFYDLDPKGYQIAETFRKNLKEMQGATGFDPTEENIKIERFGLTKEQVEQYGLLWIDNLKTSSNREAKAPPGYIQKVGGRRKCESNALFKNEATMAVAREICRKAIERYYGETCVERFKLKQQQTKAENGELFNDPFWTEAPKAIKRMITNLPKREIEDRMPILIRKENFVTVLVDEKYYGKCPGCNKLFDFSWPQDAGKKFHCQKCGLPIHLEKKTSETGEQQQC